ncbi:MAG: nickel transporter [Methyloprofundus sp.]|nr:nickel transporter [Methyloprofundus sp.]
MQIIPVIDIKAGCAVLAQQGERKNYQALSTPLCTSSQLNDVIDAYLSLYAFAQIYIADLDALMQTGNNQKLIYSAIIHYPQLNFIIDCGSFQAYDTASNVTPIIGTESVDKHTLKDIKQQTNDFILSLDFCAQNKPMGDSALYQSPHLWPKQLIIMTLALVGKNNGPDLKKLQHYYNDYPEYNFIAAGGIRHRQDLIQLKKIGIQQALVASALHNGTLTATDIRQLST